jgi:hypothetical protein
VKNALFMFYKFSWPIKISYLLSSSTLFAWLIYIAYLFLTRVDKQSVYAGSITLWTAVLLVFFFLTALVNLFLLLLSWKKKIVDYKKAVTFFGVCEVFCIVLFYVSIKIIDIRIIA